MKFVVQILEAGFNWYDMDIEREMCILDTWDIVQDVSRPPVNCDMCSLIKTVPRVKAISSQEFEDKYAYSGVPVIIKDGTNNWTAPNTFNFSFLKSIYSEDSPALANIERQCSFFPYKTSFQSLGEVFNMSEDRANLKDGTEPWYIGWYVVFFLLQVVDIVMLAMHLFLKFWTDSKSKYQ